MAPNLMTIGDAVTQASQFPENRLGDWLWGAWAVRVTNACLDDNLQLTLDSTGAHFEELIGSLPENTRMYLYSCTFHRPTALLAPLLAAVVPPVVLVEPTGDEVFPVGYIKSSRPIVTFIMAVALMLAAGNIAVKIHLQTQQAHGLPPANAVSWYERVLQWADSTVQSMESAAAPKKPVQPPPDGTGQPAPQQPADH
jgi:hypothetical protein